MTSLEIKLASIVVHFAELRVSDNSVDLNAIEGGLSDPEVQQGLLAMKKAALLPVPRSDVVYEYLNLGKTA
jgi:hypothetical protein